MYLHVYIVVVVDAYSAEVLSLDVHIASLLLYKFKQPQLQK